MTTKQKQFDVTFIQPWNGKTCTAVEAFADQLYMSDSGEMVYRYNHHYDACEVVTAVEGSQDRLDAKAAYFKRFGTACE